MLAESPEVRVGQVWLDAVSGLEFCVTYVDGSGRVMLKSGLRECYVNVGVLARGGWRLVEDVPGGDG